MATIAQMEQVRDLDISNNNLPSFELLVQEGGHLVDTLQAPSISCARSFENNEMAALSGMKNLRELILVNGCVCRGGIASLVGNEECGLRKSLRVLNIYNCKLTPEDKEALVMLNLGSLDIQECEP